MTDVQLETSTLKFVRWTLEYGSIGRSIRHLVWDADMLQPGLFERNYHSTNQYFQEVIHGWKQRGFVSVSGKNTYKAISWDQVIEISGSILEKGVE